MTITFSGAPFDRTYPAIYVSELIDGAKDVGLQLVSAADGKTLGPNESYTYAFTASLAGTPLIWRPECIRHTAK